MLAIYTKTTGEKITAYTKKGRRKGISIAVDYPENLIGYRAHFEAVKALIVSEQLDWDVTGMRWGDNGDGKGYVFCFDCSIVK